MVHTEIKEQFDALKKKIEEFGEYLDNNYDFFDEVEDILDDLGTLYYAVEQQKDAHMEEIASGYVEEGYLTILTPLTHDLSNELAIPKLEHYLATYNVAELVEFLDQSPKALL